MVRAGLARTRATNGWRSAAGAIVPQPVSDARAGRPGLLAPRFGLWCTAVVPLVSGG